MRKILLKTNFTLFFIFKLSVIWAIRGILFLELILPLLSKDIKFYNVRGGDHGFSKIKNNMDVTKQLEWHTHPYDNIKVRKKTKLRKMPLQNSICNLLYIGNGFFSFFTGLFHHQESSFKINWVFFKKITMKNVDIPKSKAIVNYHWIL